MDRAQTGGARESQSRKMRHEQIAGKSERIPNNDRPGNVADTAPGKKRIGWPEALCAAGESGERYS